MSEYQYYEFQALDQPLTPKAKALARSLSSRAQIIGNSVSFVYNYGDFRGDSLALMHEHFDAMLYITNWGTRQLMFRFPAHAIPTSVAEAYQYSLYGDGYGDQIAWLVEADHVVLNLELSETEATGEWIEGDGLLSQLTPLRTDLMRGDYRAVYLAWLRIAAGADDDPTEPPIPPNLRTRSPALESLSTFFGVDPDLVTTAAQASPAHNEAMIDLTGFIDRLTEAEKRGYLERLLHGEANLDTALARRLREFNDSPTQQSLIPGFRTRQQMVDASKMVKDARIDAERQAAEAARIKRLDTMIPYQDEIWARIPQLIAEKTGASYEEAVRHLRDLYDIAEYQHHLPEFREKLNALRAAYPTYSGLQKRIKEAGLL